MAPGFNEKFLVAVVIVITTMKAFLMECISTKYQSFFTSHSSVYHTNLHWHRIPILKISLCSSRHSRQKEKSRVLAHTRCFPSRMFSLVKCHQIQSNHHEKKVKLNPDRKTDAFTDIHRPDKKCLLLKQQHGEPANTQKGIKHKRMSLWA